LNGMDRRLRQETNLMVFIAEDPLTCVVRGAGKILEDFGKYETMLMKSQRD